MNEGKQDLEVACLQQKLEWSCWKTKNEGISLIWSCGVHPKLRDDNLPLTGKN